MAPVANMHPTKSVGQLRTRALTPSAIACTSSSSRHCKVAVAQRAHVSAQSHGSAHDGDRAPWCATAAAAALLMACTVSTQPAQAAMAAQPYAFPESALQQEEARYDENLMTPELKGFLQFLDKKGSDLKLEELQAQRSKVNFRRALDGRVSLRARDGRWYNVKADMQTPGFLLLRAEKDGSMFFLPPDDAGQLLQVDLSDDAVVAQLFSSGAWFDVMDPLKVEATPGVLEPLKLSEIDFRLTSSLLDGAEEESSEQ